jgi:drug/metabolite transporter (DMT)-like permease
VPAYLLFALCVTSLAGGQVLFKIISGHVSQPIDLIAKREAFALLLVALSLYGVATLAWILALRSLPLSHAYLFNAFSFLLVPIAAYLFLGEPIGVRYLVGSGIVLVGIWIAST